MSFFNSKAMPVTCIPPNCRNNLPAWVVSTKMNHVLLLLILLLSYIISNGETDHYAGLPGWVLSGKVIDENDAPLTGASVKVAGTAKGTSTDLYGKFLLEIESGNDSVVVTYTGYKTKILRVGAAHSLVIKLEPDTEKNKLNEVVVVGFGTQKKRSVIGAVSVIRATELQKSATPSLSNTLGGRLPGIITRQASGEPGYDAASVYIRGYSTNGDRSPLILVDGVERDMNNINAQEIESVSVLKDASATAVYGIRGANGVLLITTKRGSAGKPKIIFRTENAMLTPQRMPDYINSYEYGILVNQATVNMGLPPYFSDEQLQKYKDGSDPYLFPDVDWVDVVFRKHTKQTINNLTISGGAETYKYFVNVGYTQQQGIYNEDPANPYRTNTNMNRYNFRSNVDLNLAKNLSIQLNLAGIIQNSVYPGSSSYQIFETLKLTPNNYYAIKNPDGSNPGYSGDIALSENPFTRATGHGYVTQLLNTLQGTAVAKWEIPWVKGLSLRGSFSSDFSSSMGNPRTKDPATKQYLGKDANGVDQYKIIKQGTALGYGRDFSGNRAFYTEASLNYDRTFGKHSVSGLLVGNSRDYVDFSAATSILNLPYRRLGLASRATYNYDSRYLVEFNAGYNGSENFPKENRFGFFPSAAVGWYISNEKFWNVQPISSLKLRGSYGLVGNDRISSADRFLFLSTINKNAANYGFGPNNVVNPTGAFAEGKIGYEQVTWEVAHKADIGMDLEMWNGRIVLQLDAFKERRDKLLLQRGSVPILAGIPSGSLPYANLGITENRGFEAALQIQNRTAGGFYYSFQGNYTFARNKIIEDDSPIKPYAYQNSRGRSMGLPYGYVAIGMFTDQDDIDKSPSQTLLGPIRPGDIKYKDMNGDGQISADDQTFLGYAREPEIMFGFGATLAYRGFDASIFFTGAAHTNIFVSGYSIYPFLGGLNNYNVSREYYDHRWIPGQDNSNAKYPSVINGNNPNNYVTNSLYMKNGNYLRLKSAEVGYNAPAKFVKKFGIGSIRLFVNGMNLAIWDHVKILNPEDNNATGSGNYPLQSSLNFGLQVGFN